MTDRDSSSRAVQALEIISQSPALLSQEDSVRKTPYSVGAWIVYLETVDDMLLPFTDTSSKKKPPRNVPYTGDDLILVRDVCGRRCIKLLPKSYKLWKLHWEFCARHDIGGVAGMLELWERALATLHAFPRVWMEYLQFAHSVVIEKAPSKLNPSFLRRLANRALEALPVAQHDKIWPVLLEYYKTPTLDVSSIDTSTQKLHELIPAESKVCLLRRYLEFRPLASKEVADFFFTSLGRWGEAALLYQRLMDPSESDIATQLLPHQRQEMWMSLASICTQYPVEEELGMDWNAMVRALLANNRNKAKKSQGSDDDADTAVVLNTDELEGVLWSQLADSWIRRGEFQLARSVYEEAIEKVSRVRDFSVLLDAYLKFEEGLLEALMETQMDDDDQEAASEGAEQPQGDDDWDILLSDADHLTPTADSGNAASSMPDLELALARAEDLTARRPLMLNRVLLRQNPHDVGEWLKRSSLYLKNEQPELAAAALEEALETVNARRSVGGSPNEMVARLAKIYEEDCKNIGKARGVFERICNDGVYNFRHSDDLAECYASWVEFELRHESWDDALDIARRSVVVPPGASKVTRGLAKSLRLWDLLLDLEESLGTLQSTKDAYDRAIEQRIATPLHIINFASFLKDRKYFEESFSAYERGVELFGFPAAKVIWNAYIEAFLERYQGTKLERTRDMFDRCLEACPDEECADFFVSYGKFEEDHGLMKRALTVYRDMCNRVPASEKYTAFRLFIAKTRGSMGIPATRDIYQKAIEALEDTSAAQMCLDFAAMEASLREIDRARAIYAHGSQMADPRRNEQYWKTWNDFEVLHGNEETFREMLRIKRSVEGAFSTVNYNAAEMNTNTANVGNLTNEEAMSMIAAREGVDLDEEVQPAARFIGATKRTAAVANLTDVEERVAKLRKATAAQAVTDNDEDEIDLGDDDEEIDVGEDDDAIDLGDDDDAEGADVAPETSGRPLRGVSTKPVPKAVFGGLASST